VNPILAISNDISALPAPAFVGQLASGPTGPGGFASRFASTFAAARSAASAPESVDSGLETTDGSSDGTTAGAEVVSTQHEPVPGAGSSQLRRPLNPSSLATASTMAAVNVVVPGVGFIPAAAAQIPSSGPQTSVAQTSSPQTSLPALSFPQSGVAPALTGITQPQVKDDVAGAVQTPEQTTGDNAAAQTTPAGYSAPSLTAASFDSASFVSASIDSVAGHGGASRQETPAAVTTATQRIASSLQNELASPNPMARTEGSEVPAPPTTTGPSVSVTGLPVTGSFAVSLLGGIKNDQESLSFADGGGASGRGSWSAQPALQTDQTVAPTMPALTDLTNVKTEDQPRAVVLLASADFMTSQANTENVGAADTAVQSDVPARTGTGGPLLAAINSAGQNLASTILNPLLQWTQAGAAMGLAGARAETVPAASVRGQGVDGRNSILNSLTAAAGSASREAGPMASQTPFSIFFSGPAAGTESAASTLPRMILPETSSAIRGSHSNGAEASGARAETNLSSGASQSRTLQSGTSGSGALQNAAASNTALSSSAPSNGAASNTIRPGNKDSLSGSDSENPAAGQISRRDADLQAAGAQLAASQTGTAPAPAPAASGGVTLPLAGPATAVADPQSKAGTLPEAAPASPVPATAEMPAAAAPGQVQLAQMISRAEQSEMRIGMNTSAFGSVEVRAVVHASDVGLVIGSEKGDLRSLMASDIPAITNTLQQQSLRLNSVNFMQGFAFSNNASGGDSQQHAFATPHTFSSSPSSEAAVDDSGEPLAAGEFGGGTRGFSILA
jgi:hypothetical protein